MGPTFTYIESVIADVYFYCSNQSMQAQLCFILLRLNYTKVSLTVSFLISMRFSAKYSTFVFSSLHYFVPKKLCSAMLLSHKQSLCSSFANNLQPVLLRLRVVLLVNKSVLVYFI